MSLDRYPKPTIATVQAAPAYFDRDAGLRKVRKLTEEAQKNGADMVVFSETFIPGFPTWVHLHAPVDQHALFQKMVESSIEIPSPAFSELQRIARDNSIFLSVGISEKAPRQSIGVMWNTNLIFDRHGNMIARHRKLLPTWSEKLVWSFGDGSTMNVHDTEIGRIGALICGENTNSLAKYALISQGEQIHISTYPACFPTSRQPSAGQPYFDTLMVRACSMSYEGKVFTAVSSQALDEQGCEVLSRGDKEIRNLLDKLTYGGSMVVSPAGTLCSDVIRDNKEGIAYAVCDIATEIPFKKMHDVSGNYQRNDVFHFSIDKKVCEPVSILNDRSTLLNEGIPFTNGIEPPEQSFWEDET
ncbi:MAG: carbon-nitrogen hydrolase family protein [Desulfovibrio sp.]|jgi:nitrilase/aliphatic nitrilase|nr:carbon-nitrogen hydrolase family protein [Desulfovibrio sp.]